MIDAAPPLIPEAIPVIISFPTEDNLEVSTPSNVETNPLISAPANAFTESANVLAAVELTSPIPFNASAIFFIASAELLTLPKSTSAILLQ